jgi:lipid A 3-O-deacylase
MLDAVFIFNFSFIPNFVPQVMTKQLTKIRHSQKIINLLQSHKHYISVFFLTSLMTLASAIKIQAEPTEQTPKTEENSAKNLSFMEKGYQTWYLQGAAATTLDNQEPDIRRFGFVGVGISEFLFNRHSINLEFNTIYFDQPGENAVGFNLALLGRWHWLKTDNWSTYIDGGAGVMGTTNDVPRQAAGFNFTPQVGGGFSIKLNEKQTLLFGLRWHHISHADTFGKNPGRDSLLGYIRLDLPR